MSRSIHDTLSRTRKPRVHISYEVHIGDATELRGLQLLAGECRRSRACCGDEQRDPQLPARKGFGGEGVHAITLPPVANGPVQRDARGAAAATAATVMAPRARWGDAPVGARVDVGVGDEAAAGQLVPHAGRAERPGHDAGDF